MNTTDKVRDLTSRKAIVIGANGGIGSCVARALASRGIAAALVGRNKDALTTVAQTCNEAGAESFPLHCDIAQIDSIESTVKTAIDRLDGLHYLINCAGVSAKEKLHETDLTSSDRFLIQILEHTCISLDIHSRKLTGMSVAR